MLKHALLKNETNVATYKITSLNRNLKLRKLKRGCSSKNFTLKELALGRALSAQKIHDLKELMQYNSDWHLDPELAWYRAFFIKMILKLSKVVMSHYNVAV